MTIKFSASDACPIPLRPGPSKGIKNYTYVAIASSKYNYNKHALIMCIEHIVCVDLLLRSIQGNVLKCDGYKSCCYAIQKV